MKFNKLAAAGFAVVLAVVLIPLVSVSKDNSPKVLLLDKSNLLVLNSEVNGDSVGPLITKARELDSKLGYGKHILLYLNSPGGSVKSGLELIEAMKGLNHKVDTITAFSASMAFQIAENLDNRYILQSGILMSHRAAGEFAGSFGGTSPSQLDSRIHLYVQITKEMDEETVRRTNGKQTLESYQKAYSNELWMTGQEAINGGYADSIVRVKCTSDLSGLSTHSVEFLGMQIEYQLSDCPINTSPMNVKVGGLAGITNSEYAKQVKAQFLSNYDMRSTKPLPFTY